MQILGYKSISNEKVKLSFKSTAFAVIYAITSKSK